MYESLYEVIIRECLEETGYSVFPDKFAALYEEICDNETFRNNYPDNYPDYAHKIYHIICCLPRHEITRNSPRLRHLFDVCLTFI